MESEERRRIKKREAGGERGPLIGRKTCEEANLLGPCLYAPLVQ